MESSQLPIFQRIEAGVRRDKRCYGLGEASLAYLLREDFAEASYRNSPERRENHARRSASVVRRSRTTFVLIARLTAYGTPMRRTSFLPRVMAV